MRRIAGAGLFLLAAGGAVAAPAPLRFDDAFAARGEPATIHYHVAYRAGGAVHGLDVWRDGDRRLRRATDAAILTYATHAPGDPGYRLTVLDLRRRSSTMVDRTNLYRIGAVTDWYDLGHGLRHPRGLYLLARAAPPAGASAPLRPCAWYALAEAGQTSRICWSAAERLPMLIAAADGRTIWRITALDHRAPPPGTFVVADKGFVRTDANADIEND